MSSARLHIRNLSANWISHGANLVVMFFLTPFIIHTLGKVEYGIWSLLMVLTGYMGFLDLGVRASTSRYIILYLGRGDHTRVDETIRTSLGFFSAIGLLMLAGGVLLGWGFPSFFRSVSAGYRPLVAVLLPVLALNLWASAVGAVFSSVLIAHERFDLTRGVDLGVLTVRTTGTVFALIWGYGIIGLAVVTVACGLAGMVGNYGLARRLYPDLRLWPLALTRSRLRELMVYGVAAFVGAIASKIVGQTDLVVVGALISVPMVTVYSVGAMLVYYFGTFMSLIGSTFFPSVQRAVSRGERDRVRWYYFRQVRLALVFGLPAYIGFMVFGHGFLRLWMEGPEFPAQSVRQAALVMLVLSVSKMVFLPGVGAGQLLAAFGRIRFNAIISIVEAVLNLGLSIFFVTVLDWGLLGVAAGTLAAGFLLRGLVHPWRALRCVKLAYTSLLKVAAYGAIAGGAFGVWCLGVRWLIPAESWPKFVLAVGLALGGYVPLALWLLVPGSDRKRIFRALGIIRDGQGAPS